MAYLAGGGFFVTALPTCNTGSANLSQVKPIMIVASAAKRVSAQKRMQCKKA